MSGPVDPPPGSCPDASRLRLAADDPLDLDALGVASHAARCPACGPRLSAARTEVRALEDALRTADGPPPGALERALARLAEEPDDAGASPMAASDGRLPAARRGKTSRAARPAPRRARDDASRAALVALAVLVAGALVLLIGRRPPPAPGPEPTPTPVTPPRVPPRPRPSSEPARATERTAPPDRATEPAPLPDRATEWGPEPSSEPPPDTEEPVVATTDTAQPPATPAPPTTTAVAPAAAVVDVRLRAGRLTRVGGAAFAVGELVPVGAAVEAGAGGADVDVGGAVRVALAARARVTVAATSEDGPIEVALARGALAARSVASVGGSRAYAVVTPEGRALPSGTTFLVARTGERTRVTTLDGAVRLRAPDRPDGDEVVVRAGFEAEAAARRPPSLPRPAAHVDAAWLPDDLRPARLELPRLLLDLAFEAGADGVGRATWRAGGARGSRGCLVGIPDAGGVYARVVELERPGGGVFAIDPDAVVEAVVRVERARPDDARPVRVALQVWDGSENRALLLDLSPGRFVPIGARMRDLTGPSGEPRPAPVGGRAESLAVFAGQAGEELVLLVDDLRVSR